METLGIYVQIPFCASKCSFCNFSSRVERAEVFGNYAPTVCREIESLPEIYQGHGIETPFLSRPVDTAYLGGGTPAILGVDLLSEIVSSLQNRFSFADSVEFTLETTPGSADREFLRRASALGINRLSIGAQSFEEHELKSVGRLHSAEDTCALVESTRREGFRNISLDLIAGLPHQTDSSWQRTLATTVALRPEHVSVYLFEIDSKSRLGNEVRGHGSRYHAAHVPDEEFMAQAYETARDALTRAGYVQYEISNFALVGFESRHNLKYWQLKPYVGIGAGAHSFDGVHRWANVAEPGDYTTAVLSGDSPIADCRSLSSEEQVEEFFFLGLRQREGIDLEQARRRWGPELVARWAPTISHLAREGMLDRQSERLSLADHAYLISNEIFQEFLAP